MPAHHKQIPAIGTLGKDSNGIREALCVSMARYGLASLDCAPRYENLDEVRKSLRQTSLERECLRITSKINAARQEHSTVQRSVLEDLESIGVDYLDCYLIHSPRYRGYAQTWRDMQEEKSLGRIVEMGVANFEPDDLSMLPMPRPAVMQVSAPQFYSGSCPKPGRSLRIELYGVISFFLRLPSETRGEFSALCADLELNEDEGILISCGYEGVIPVLGTSRVDRLERQIKAYDRGLERPDFAARLSGCLRRLYA